MIRRRPSQCTPRLCLFLTLCLTLLLVGCAATYPRHYASDKNPPPFACFKAPTLVWEPQIFLRLP